MCARGNRAFTGNLGNIIITTYNQGEKRNVQRNRKGRVALENGQN